MRHSRVLLILSLSLAGRQAMAQSPTVPAPDTLGANFPADTSAVGSPTDYAALIGQWRITFQSRNPDGTWGIARPGHWSFRQSSAWTILDEFGLDLPDGTRTSTMTFRAWDAQHKQWALQGRNSRTPGWEPGMSASSNGDILVVQHEGSLLFRVRYYQIAPDHFLWRSDLSRDGGQTWLRDARRIEATRIRGQAP